MAKKRNPSFEILRVVAMFLIVVWHFLMHGVGQKPDGITGSLTVRGEIFFENNWLTIW